MEYFTLKNGIQRIALFILIFLLPKLLYAIGGGCDTENWAGSGSDPVCDDIAPFCSDQNYDFPNISDGSAAGGTDARYGCLGQQPNPVWYYMEIETPGVIEVRISQSTGAGGSGAGLDVDFALWGPYNSYSEGCTAISNGDNSIQCSYDPSSVEYLGLGTTGGSNTQYCGESSPPEAQVGEVYIILITNYDAQSGYIQFTQTNVGDPGAGSTDCSIVEPCLINNFTANISACTNDLYSVDGTIEVDNAPDNGDLIVEDCNGNQTIVASAPFTSTTYNYTLSNLDANGAACDVEVYFTDETSCSQTINYTAPACPASCNFDLIDITIQPCNGANQFDITGTVEFTNPPIVGTLTIADCNGNSVTFNAPFTSPQSFTISDIDADGASCNLSASFSADPSCNIDIDYNNVADCSCNAQIGTFTVSTTGTQSGNDITLCEGQEFTFVANGDYTPADDISEPTVTYDPGIWWAVYTCPPTIGLTPAAGVDINTDPCLLTFIPSGSITDVNDMSFINSFPPGTFTDNIVYFVPITIYSGQDALYSLTATGIPCYDMGEVYAVQYLPEIIINETTDCQAGTVSVTISGSSPEINGTNFTGTATNLSPPTASFDNSSVANNGTIVVSGLQDGDNYSFDIVDEFGCDVNISGVFQGVSASDFSYSKSEYCQDESNPTPTITGETGGTFTVSPSGLSINSSTGGINLNSSTAGTYTVSYASPGAPCNSTSTFEITVNPVPSLSVPTVMCEDGDVQTITATPINGSWSSSDHTVATVDANGLVTSVGPGTVVISYEVNGCTEEVSIEVEPKVVPTFTQIADFCEGSPAPTLPTTSNNGIEGTWSPAIVNSNVGSTIYTFSPNAGLCANQETMEITVNPLPTPSIDAINPLCENENEMNLVGNPSGGTFSGTGVSNGSFNPATAGVGTHTITYDYEDGNQCSASTTIQIVVNSAPTFSFSSSDPTCGDSDGSITISGLDPSTSYELTYTASGTSVGPQNEVTNAAGEIVIDNLAQGSYTGFTIEGMDGCSTTDPSSISLNDINGPSVTAPNDIDICIGESVTLSAVNPSGATIVWDNGVTNGLPFIPTSPGTQTYTVTATDVNNCKANDVVVVTVHGLPGVNAGQDQSICHGESTAITATGASTYSWDNSLGNGASHTVSPIVTTTYLVTGTDGFGCVNSDQVVVTVIENPVPDFDADNLSGCEPHTVNFTNNTGLTGASCNWNFGDGNTSNLCNGVSHTYDNRGVYNVSLTITDANGCSGTTTEQNYIEVTPKPSASFTADPMATGTSDPVINFTNTTVNGTDFTWDFGDKSSVEYTYDATHTFPDNEGSEYIVTLVASSGPNCNDTARVVVKIEEELIYYVPNSFTPDADDYNETFKPIFTSGFDPQEYNLKIFNRWGEIVFESNNSDYGWDGTYGETSNEKVKEGVYVWKITFKNTNNDARVEAVGSVTLLK